jgi:hypothetical protein
MSVSEPDADRVAEASSNDRDTARKRRFARRPRAEQPVDVAPAVFVPHAAAPPPSGWHDDASHGDAWSHEPATRRFVPSESTAAPASETPGWPSVATRAFESTVPAHIPEGLARITSLSHENRATSLTPAPEVIDEVSNALADLAEPAAGPRREPGSRSVPPPGFGTSENTR